MAKITGSMLPALESNMIVEVREVGRLIKFSPISKGSLRRKKKSKQTGTQSIRHLNQAIQAVL